MVRNGHGMGRYGHETDTVSDGNGTVLTRYGSDKGRDGDVTDTIRTRNDMERTNTGRWDTGAVKNSDALLYQKLTDIRSLKFEKKNLATKSNDKRQTKRFRK